MRWDCPICARKNVDHFSTGMGRGHCAICNKYGVCETCEEFCRACGNFACVNCVAECKTCGRALCILCQPILENHYEENFNCIRAQVRQSYLFKCELQLFISVSEVRQIISEYYSLIVPNQFSFAIGKNSVP